MKEIFRFGFILAFICLIAAGLLAAVNVITAPKILAQALAEEQAALKEVMPQASKFIAVKSDVDEQTLYYKAFDDRDKIIGFVFKAAGKGYSSLIQTLVGVDPKGIISAIKVLSQNETPGLGIRITEKKFTDQFKNQDSLTLSGVQAISGATVSSRALMKSVIKKAQEIEGLIKNEK